MSAASHFGLLLRQWRGARRLSQLGLSLEADVSARHLSYVETGRASPSRDVVTRLCDALDMPLRERNKLLVAAGFAPEYRESEITTAEMAPVRRAIDLMLEHHEPYPALVMNRHWDVVMTNRALPRVIGRLFASKHHNVLRQIFDPTDLRAIVVNWEEVAGDLIRHLHNQVAAAPSDDKARALLAEMLSYPGVPARFATRDPSATPLPLLTTVLRDGDATLSFFSTFTTFGTPQDITLDELRIECLFAADERTGALCWEAARS
jgi:transcriptional regulator with XRE-family HTH domain